MNIVTKSIKNPKKALKIIFFRRFDALSPFFKGRSLVGNAKRNKFSDLDSLVSAHFRESPSHPCRKTLHHALALGESNPMTIIETGSSAWGTNSSELFDSYVNTFGGSFNTVDIRATPMLELRAKCTSNTILHCNDSVNFLAKLNLNDDEKKLRKLFYLDSCDVDWDKPIASMIHGLNEFLCMISLLKSGDIVLIDDTPKDYEVLIRVQGAERANEFLDNFNVGIVGGKGSLIRDYVLQHKLCEVIEHDYQLLLKVN